MKAKALTSFAGVKYSAIPGDVIDICEKEIYEDLLNAGFIEASECEDKTQAKTVDKPRTSPKKKTTK